MEHLLEVKNLSVSINGPAGEVQAVRDVSFSLKKGRGAGYSWRIRMREECALQKYHEAFATKRKNKRGKHLCKRTGYHLLQGKGDAETAWKSFFYDLSGSYDIPESNY